MFGRTELEWGQLRQAAEDHLITVAQERSMTDYSLLNRVLSQVTGLRGFDFSQESERAAIGKMLGEISRASYADHSILLSALVTHRGSNNEGAGFYKLAAELNEMPVRPSEDQKLVAVSRLVAKAHDYYGRG